MRQKMWLIVFYAVFMFSCSTPGPIGMLGQEVVGDCTAHMTVYPTSAQSKGSIVSMDTSGSCISGTPEYKYYLREPSGVWKIARDWSVSSSFSWNTDNQPLGAYLVQVWIRRQGQTFPYEGATASHSFDLVASVQESCTVKLTSYPSSQQAKGGDVPFSVVGSCSSGTPEYKYYLREPSGAWKIARDWSVSSSFSWNTDNQPLGTYFVQVWIRRQGQTVPYQAASITKSFELLSALPCTDVSATYTKNAGVYTLRFTPTCPTGTVPEYSLQELSPRFNNYTTVQDWTSTNTFVLESTQVPTGYFHYIVRIRAKGSTVTEDASARTSFILGRCHHPKATPDFSSPTIEGRSVTWTFSSSCDPNLEPEYLLYYRPDSSATWTKLKDWDSKEKYVWSTPTNIQQTSSFHFQVWVRAIGKSALYEDASPVVLYDVNPSNPAPASVQHFDQNGLKGVSHVSHDASGNTYISGSYSYQTLTFGTQRLYRSGGYIAKMDSQGQWLWAKSFQGVYPIIDEFEYLGTAGKHIVDSQGNVYVSGTFKGTMLGLSTTSSKTYVAKLNAQGSLLWIKSIDTSSVEIYAHTNGNIVVVGDFENPLTLGSIQLQNSSAKQVFVAQMDTNGNWVWAKSTVSSSEVTVFFPGVYIDGLGNIFISGKKKGTPLTFASITLNATSQYFLAKLDKHGQGQWAKAADEEMHLTGDGNNIYVVGYFQTQKTFGTTTLTGYKGMYVAKMDTNGNWLWATLATGIDVGAKSIAADNQGNLYIAGYNNWEATLGTFSLSAPKNREWFLAKLGANGTWLHVQKVTSSIALGGKFNAPFEPYISGMFWNSNGKLYVYGRYTETLDFQTYTLPKSNSGETVFLWELPAP